MKPEPAFQNELVTLYHGDSLDILPLILDEELAAIVTDPPYSSGTRTEAKRGSAQKNAMLRGARFRKRPIANDQLTTPGFVWLIREVFGLAVPWLRDGGHALSFIDWRQWPNLLGALESLNLRSNNMVVWDKLTMGLGNGFRNRHELIIHASRGVPIPCDRSIPNVIRCPRDRNVDHQSPKPVPLLEKLLRVVSSPGDLVLDPFVGAGALLVAANRLGRRAIGIEIVEKDVRTAIARLTSPEAKPPSELATPTLEDALSDLFEVS